MIAAETRAHLVSFPRALYDAIGAQDFDGVYAAIESGANVDWKPPILGNADWQALQTDSALAGLISPAQTAVTPLAFAVRKSAPKIVEALLKAGAHPDTRGQGTTAVLECAIKPTATRLKILQRLVAAGASVKSAGPHTGTNPTDTDSVDWQPLWVAVGARKPSPTCIQILLAAGADPNVGYTDRAYGFVSALYHAVTSGNVDIARLLLDAGAKVNPPVVKNMYDPLAYAMRSNNVAMIELLVSRGATPM